MKESFKLSILLTTVLQSKDRVPICDEKSGNQAKPCPALLEPNTYHFFSACRHHGRDEAMIQFTKSLSALAVEQVDLFLLHYPACWPELCGEGYTPKGTWHDSWRALEELIDKGLVRAIGARPLQTLGSTLPACRSFTLEWIKMACMCL